MSETKQNQFDLGFFIFCIGAVFLIILGLSLIVSDAFAVNQTAIDEIHNDLADELETTGFSVFWLIFLLVALTLFMIASIRLREDREMVFFSIGALVICFLLAIIFTSPIDFDYLENKTTVTVIERDDNGTAVYDSGVQKIRAQVVVIPNDTEFRFALSLLFTALGIFNGLYSVFILTNFSTKGSFTGKSKP